jgi:DnaJ-class molecular chaperone
MSERKRQQQLSPTDWCKGSGKTPTSTHQSIGRAAALWGYCPVCQGSYLVDSNDVLVQHRPVR